MLARENKLDNKVTLVKGAMEDVQLPVDKVTDLCFVLFCFVLFCTIISACFRLMSSFLNGWYVDGRGQVWGAIPCYFHVAGLLSVI